ncbi:hypothetical protein HPP92_006972 [Vanilla planifolia]|uniref:Uncharacterized protein n=1 Tax=Vanilla planifolia TaxID=51239 RepID=A0A835RJF3_VANPL|nr:hypothetical protein HPP92_006972 [Vanilla planifolia]
MYRLSSFFSSRPPAEKLTQEEDRTIKKSSIYAKGVFPKRQAVSSKSVPIDLAYGDKLSYTVIALTDDPLVDGLKKQQIHKILTLMTAAPNSDLNHGFTATQAFDSLTSGFLGMLGAWWDQIPDLCEKIT